MITTVQLINGFVALVLAALIAFTTTPLVRLFAYKIGAIDVPRDNRRMHDHPIPRLGGLAIFIAFVITTIMFCEYSPILPVLWFGGLVMAVLGVLDDVFRLNAFVKLAVQIAAAFIPISQGYLIEYINIFGNYIDFGPFAIPVTLLWVVGLTNAINFIDGLDGLSCGISAICSLSLLFVTLIMAEPSSALLMAILAGSCLGFLPFNTNPAKIFMGDTGALFLGYTLAVLSIGGLFKFHTVVSFMIPISIFAIPIFDTAFAVFRRLLHGKSPFAPDRGHLHHRLIDMGFNQKQSVYILYSICGILGISAVIFTGENFVRAIVLILIGLAIFVGNLALLKYPQKMHNVVLPHDGEDDSNRASVPKSAEKDEAEDKNSAE